MCVWAILCVSILCEKLRSCVSICSNSLRMCVCVNMCTHSLRSCVCRMSFCAYERLPEVIGSGAFSTVYKGRHKLSGSFVAIKVFTEDMGNRFLHTIRCFELLMGVSSGISSPSEDGVCSHSSFRPNRDLLNQLRARELVVRLLDYSRCSDGRPGRQAGEYFLVMELGDCSLEEYIDSRSCFSVEEVRIIVCEIAKVASLLHYHGLAHLDIKPANIMLFNETNWKLIDFDGCYMAASVVDVIESDVAFTPLYCAPEIANLIVQMVPEFKVSRLMDVWSIGMIAAELVTLRPCLEQTYLKYLKKNNDDTLFLRWLADENTQINLSQVEKFDLELYMLLKNKILVKASQRASLPEILQHSIFKIHHHSITWKLPQKNAKPPPKPPRLIPIKTYVMCSLIY